LAQEKIRIFALARQLNLQAKDLLELCQRHGINVTNQLSTLDPDQRDQVVELVRKGVTAPQAGGSRASQAALPPKDRNIKTLPPAVRPTAPKAPVAVPVAISAATVTVTAVSTAPRPDRRFSIRTPVGRPSPEGIDGR